MELLKHIGVVVKYPRGKIPMSAKTTHAAVLLVHQCAEWRLIVMRFAAIASLQDAYSTGWFIMG